MKKVFGLVVTLVILSLAVGSFAPSLIALQTRPLSVPLISDDSNSLISVRNSPGSPYQFVSYKANGKFEITVQLSNGVPLNPFSENWFDNCVDIFNQGLEKYKITIASDNPRIKFYTMPGNWWPSTGRAGALQTLQLTAGGGLPAGWTWMIGLYVDATGLPTGSTISAHITVTAVNP